VLGERTQPVLLATREAVVNAARHAGSGRVDVYAEASPSQLEVFVTDRGRGFDPDAVAADRHGVRGSIVDRMERHGGSARVTSRPGEGTEVVLKMSLEDKS
jgi:signal transduction histidine kinase